MRPLKVSKKLKSVQNIGWPIVSKPKLNKFAKKAMSVQLSRKIALSVNVRRKVGKKIQEDESGRFMRFVIPLRHQLIEKASYLNLRYTSTL